ncbi:amino acid ABC transporter permease [Pseudodesulfovibrio senegalensis]|uniref:Putative glutamine transport system permease protein GlnP n=1 Tax=Pseudodesulfovibrio senegalensis TaxID=1721087 RepID=A0A6N6N6R1_9BACT|nr:amino acid ABC transporter permease [Pseudodesulfovibrio senegalensis]KAB1443716.1 amino acid ABC transporter permease [Pseudodesulfovibrio senegalensis]
MDFSLIFEHYDLFLMGALNTLKITMGALLMGLFLGTFAGVFRISRSWWLRLGADTYIQLIRGTPMLLQIYFFFFGLPQLYHVLTGGRMPQDPLWLGMIALGINSGAYTAEIIRAGILSINRGQMEAARCSGLSHRQAMVFVILPQAFKRMIPPLCNELIVLLKDSSLVSVVGYGELMFTAKVLGAKYYTYVPFLLGVGLIYLTLTFTFAKLLDRLERKLSEGSSRDDNNMVLDLG